MKALLGLTVLIMSAASFAMPYRCTSVELKEGAPVVTFKINPKRVISDNGEVYERWVIGVSPTGKSRFVLYGQGTVDETSIGMTFVEDQTVTGWMRAYDRGETDVMEGEFKHSDVSHETLHIKCVNVALSELSAPTLVTEKKTTFKVTKITIK